MTVSYVINPFTGKQDAVTPSDTTAYVGMLKGNGTAISTATPNVDYVPAKSPNGFNTVVVDDQYVLFETNNTNGIEFSTTDTINGSAYTTMGLGQFNAFAETYGSFYTLGSFLFAAGNVVFLLDSVNGVFISDEMQTNSVTLNTAGFDVAATAITYSNGLGNYATDALAAAGGVPLNGLYRTANVVKIRIV